MAVNGGALAAVGAGTLLVWSGIKGWSIMGVTGDLITGKKPSQAVSYPLGTGAVAAAQAGANAITGGKSGFGVSSGRIIAETAMKYVGHAYKFGGAPGPNAANPWDCSSMVNYIIGVELGLAIPGNSPGKYKGTVHGPPTGTWYVWPGLMHVKREEIQAGDIVVWATHMGIILGSDSMISALNPKITTKVTPIRPTGPAIYGRHLGINPNIHPFE